MASQNICKGLQFLRPQIDHFFLILWFCVVLWDMRLLYLSHIRYFQRRYKSFASFLLLIHPVMIKQTLSVILFSNQIFLLFHPAEQVRQWDESLQCYYYVSAGPIFPPITRWSFWERLRAHAYLSIYGIWMLIPFFCLPLNSGYRHMHSGISREKLIYWNHNGFIDRENMNTIVSLTPSSSPQNNLYCFSSP